MWAKDKPKTNTRLVVYSYIYNCNGIGKRFVNSFNGLDVRKRKKESPVWGYLTYIYCGLGSIGLIYEFWFKFEWFK